MRKIIKKHVDFVVSDQDVCARATGFIIRMRPTRFPGDARYGLVVTKRTFRHAVDRNRAKRLLRVWIRRTDRLMRPDYDYIFIARPAILKCTLSDGVGAMTRALRFLKRNPTGVAHA